MPHDIIGYRADETLVVHLDAEGVICAHPEVQMHLTLLRHDGVREIMSDHKRVVADVKEWLQMRELKSDLTLIVGYKDQRNHAGWSAFVRSMSGRAYGREALNDAWSWFKKGWEG